MDENADVVAMLCRRIKMARIDKNLSQVELAERSKVGIATIKRIELGESITLLTLIAVLRGLDELDQLNNLLVHNELKIASQKNIPQRKRKIKEQQAQNDLMSNEFLISNVNNMHWKY